MQQNIGKLLRSQPLHVVSATGEREDHVALHAQGARGGHDRVELVHAAEIARIADDEPALAAPFAPQRGRLRRQRPDGAAVGPVVDHRDALAASWFEPLDNLAHAIAQDDVQSSGPQGVSARRARERAQHAAADTQAQPLRDLRKHVLQPVDQPRAAQSGGKRRGQRRQRRIGHRHDQVAGARQRRQTQSRGKVERQVIQRPARQRAAAETAGPDAMHAHAFDHLFRGQARRRILVALPAGDHVHLPPAAREMQCEIRQQLARRREIGTEIPVDEDQLHGAAPRRTTQSPITRRSMRVRRKQSSASSGRHTTGSFSLNEVFSSIGTPVRPAKASIRR